jgi:hypothetical protein
VKDTSATSNDVRAIGGMVERLESSVNALAEGLTSFRSELKTDLRALEIRLTERIELLEDVVRKNSEDIRKNSEDIRLMKIEIAELRLRFDRRDTGMTSWRAASLRSRSGSASRAEPSRAELS